MKKWVFVWVLCFFVNKNYLYAAAGSEKSFISGDVGVSTGDNNGKTYQEVHLGIDMNFTDWLTWRNSGFKRTGSNIQEVTGVDSTLRLVAQTRFDKGYAQIFSGGGYRWASGSNNNAWLGEAGVGAGFAGIGINGGAKYLKYDKPRTDSTGATMKDNEITYFVSATGNLSFGK